MADLQHALTSIWPDPTALLSPSLGLGDLFQGCSLPQAPSASEQLMLADTCAYLPNDILVKVDRAAMAASLETRAPFLDHRVASLAWQLPLALKLRNGVGKWALRQLLDRGLRQSRLVLASRLIRPRGKPGVRPLGRRGRACSGGGESRRAPCARRRRGWQDAGARGARGGAVLEDTDAWLLADGWWRQWWRWHACVW